MFARPLGMRKEHRLTMVAGLNPITEGGVVVANHEIEGPGPDRGVVFQSPCLMPWMTAMENVLLGVNQVYPHGTKAERQRHRRVLPDAGWPGE